MVSLYPAQPSPSWPLEIRLALAVLILLPLPTVGFLDLWHWIPRTDAGSPTLTGWAYAVLYLLILTATGYALIYGLLLRNVLRLSRAAQSAGDSLTACAAASDETGALATVLDERRTHHQALLAQLHDSERQYEEATRSRWSAEHALAELRRRLPSEDTAADAAWTRRLRRGLDEDKFHLTSQWLMPAGALTAERATFEILLTLEDEEGFWVEPAVFLPMAERLQLATEIDRWVIRRTLESLEHAPPASDHIGMVCINLSNDSVREAGMLEFLLETFDRARRWPGVVCFELRESTLCEHPAEAAAFCETLHHLGVRISVDRFSARDPARLAQLARLPLDYVKLDGRHLRNLGRNSAERELAESGLRLGRLQKRGVVVTGIEDLQTLPVWRQLGVDFLQGYAIAHPTPMLFSRPKAPPLEAHPPSLKLLKTIG